MNLKQMLHKKGIKQVDLVKELGVDPGRVSLQVNCIRDLPEKHQEKLARILQVSLQELKGMIGGVS